MIGKHQKTLRAIFADPVRSNINWVDIEFVLNGIRATFHRPHPKKETDRGAVKSVRRFLEEGGIKP